MVIMVVRSRGTPDGGKGWLLSPGHPVSGLASANTTTSGEEFLDGEVEDWDSLRSIFCTWRKEKGRWMANVFASGLASFYPFTTLSLWVVVC